MNRSIGNGHGHQFKPVVVAQRKTPVAPPVYRPQPLPRVLQTKTPSAPPPYRPPAKPGGPAKIAGAAQMKPHPVAPPVYRPQPIPKVLQTKQLIKQQAGPRQHEPKRIATPNPLPSAIQRRQDPNARRVGNVVQRDVDVSRALKTENGLYMVLPGDKSILYSDRKAPDLKPQGLYMRWRDRATHTHQPLYGWKPNVRFLSKAEGGASEAKGKPGGFEYTVKGSLMDKVHRFSLRGLGAELEAPPETEERPTMGVLGKNDCYAFADTMQNMIVTQALAENAVPVTGRTKKSIHVQKPQKLEDMTVEVGDMMRHIYTKGSCRYHAATVVAKDGKSLVTLEGHVGKDLQRPEFLIRNGVLDFAAEGIMDDAGDEVEITPLESLNPETVASDLESAATRYQRMTSANVHDPSTMSLAISTASSNIGLTFTNEVRRRIEAQQRRRAEFRAIYKRDKAIHKENVRRAKVGEPLLKVEYTSFPRIE